MVRREGLSPEECGGVPQSRAHRKPAAKISLFLFFFANPYSPGVVMEIGTWVRASSYLSCTHLLKKPECSARPLALGRSFFANAKKFRRWFCGISGASLHS